MQVTVDLTVNVWEEGGQYVAHALPLDVMSSGPTPEAARQAVDEAVRCFLLTLHDRGTFESVMEECGYVRRNGRWTGPTWVGVERHSLPVAF